MVFTLRQDGNNLTGTVEGGNGGFFGGSDIPAEITEGKVADGKASPSKPERPAIRGL